MSLPDYQRAFDTRDFQGYFTWDKKLSRVLDINLYHACHRSELKQIIAEGQISLRSEWALRHPQFGLVKVPGTWCGFNYFNYGNYYGPFLIELPISVLNGRTFMVFRRSGEDRRRYFFAQYETKIPLFEYKGNTWRIVEPTIYFERKENYYKLKRNAIYDMILTAPLSISKAKIEAVSHPKCISKKCSGSLLKTNYNSLIKIASTVAIDTLSQNVELQKLIRRFPCLNDIRLDMRLLI